MIKFPIIVAYNMKEKKVGCALIQAALGSTFSGGDVTFYFDTLYWEMNPSKCQLYQVRSQTEFDLMLRLTKEEYENKRTISQHQSGGNQSKDPGG